MLVAMAGRRWSIEHAFEAVRQEAGLDDCEVLSATGWDRYVTLALLAVVCVGDGPGVPPKRVPERTAWRPSNGRATWSGAEAEEDPAPAVASGAAGAARGVTGVGLILQYA